MEAGAGGAELRGAVEVERAVGAAGLLQQTGPGEGAVADLGAPEVAEGPALEVRAVHRRVDQQAATSGVQAHAELDVLDRWPREAGGVEAAGVGEGVAADGAESGPEGRGRAGVGGVHVVVSEVRVPRGGTWGGRVGVVAAEDRDELAVVVVVVVVVGGDGAVQLGDGVGVRHDVGVDEEQPVVRVDRQRRGRGIAGGGGAGGRLVNAHGRMAAGLRQCANLRRG